MRTGARLSAVNISHAVWLHCSQLYFRLLHLSGTRFGAGQIRHLHREGGERSAVEPDPLSEIDPPPIVGGPAAHESNAAASWNWLAPQAQKGWPLASLTPCPLREEAPRLLVCDAAGLEGARSRHPPLEAAHNGAAWGQGPMQAPGKAGLRARRDQGCDWVARRVTTPKVQDPDRKRKGAPRPLAMGKNSTFGPTGMPANINLATP